MFIYDMFVELEVSRVEEEGVWNVIVQDICFDDKVGYVGFGWDKSVWFLVVNVLMEDYDWQFLCDKGLFF